MLDAVALAVAEAAEEDARRGRRQHRKRVARIVADQWKWFARNRLQVGTTVFLFMPLPIKTPIVLHTSAKRSIEQQVCYME